jgi:hypothetical protein
LVICFEAVSVSSSAKEDAGPNARFLAGDLDPLLSRYVASCLPAGLFAFVVERIVSVFWIIGAGVLDCASCSNSIDLLYIFHRGDLLREVGSHQQGELFRWLLVVSRHASLIEQRYIFGNLEMG